MVNSMTQLLQLHMSSSLYLLKVKILTNFSYCAFVVVNDVSKFSEKVPKTHIDILNKSKFIPRIMLEFFLGAYSTNSFETIHILVSQKKLQFFFQKCSICGSLSSN